MRALDREVRATARAAHQGADRTRRPRASASTAQVDWRPGYAVLVNTPEETAFAREVALELVGAEQRHRCRARRCRAARTSPSCSSSVPGSYLFIGNGDGDSAGGCMVHNPGYDFNDDNVAIGVGLLGAADRALPGRLKVERGGGRSAALPARAPKRKAARRWILSRPVPPCAMTANRTPALLAASAALFALLLLSGLHPHDRATWWMEVAPVLIALPLLWATYRGFPLTPLLYALIFVHCCVLMLGGAYSYARVPLGFWLQDLMHLGRNPYDKIGHFMQGFVPALIAREILIRGHHVQGRRMLAFVVVCIVMAISASYELIEWAAALAMGQGADEFLGTAGRPLGHAVGHVHGAGRRGGGAAAAQAPARPADRRAGSAPDRSEAVAQPRVAPPSESVGRGDDHPPRGCPSAAPAAG